MAFGLRSVRWTPGGLGNGVDIAVPTLLLTRLQRPCFALGAFHERVPVLLRSAGGLEVLSARTFRRLWVDTEVKLCFGLGFFWAEKVWYVVVCEIFAGRPRLGACLVGLGMHWAESSSSKVSIQEAFICGKAFISPGQTHTQVLNVLAVGSVVSL